MKICVGLLPLYLKLYDDTCPEMRPKIEEFYAEVVKLLGEKGIGVLTSPVCRLEEEFRAAIASFERSGADALITLHLAYSPSLESARPLAETELPVLVLDTTPDYLFDASVDSEKINYNHGIHGVQDMCNMLMRNGKPFYVFAGHYLESDVLLRITKAARAASAAANLRRARVGLVGEPFGGMGDFALPFDELKRRLGMEVVRYDFKKAGRYLDEVSDQELDAEMERDFARYQIKPGVTSERYRATERVGLSIRRWIRDEGLTGFSMNFCEAGLHRGFPTMPFSEASKAMARGVGYAGEGDVMDAALVGALLSAHEETTFAEMFCPDWKGGSIYLSHMGEFNLKTAREGVTMIKKPFPYAPGFDPCTLVGAFKPGDACLVNLAPKKDGFKLILAPGRMLELPEDLGSFEDSVSGWFKPGPPLGQFLEEYSAAGGTHHCALVYGAQAGELKLFADLMSFEAALIK